MWRLFSHLCDFDIIFKLYEIWNTLVDLLKVPTHTRTHINTHYWMKIAARAITTQQQQQCFACRRAHKTRSYSWKMSDWMQPFPKGRGCTMYICIELNEGIMKQRITDTIALILDRLWALGIFDVLCMDIMIFHFTVHAKTIMFDELWQPKDIFDLDGFWIFTY